MARAIEYDSFHRLRRAEGVNKQQNVLFPLLSGYGAGVKDKGKKLKYYFCWKHLASNFK